MLWVAGMGGWLCVCLCWAYRTRARHRRRAALGFIWLGWLTNGTGWSGRTTDDDIDDDDDDDECELVSCNEERRESRELPVHHFGLREMLRCGADSAPTTVGLQVLKRVRAAPDFQALLNKKERIFRAPSSSSWFRSGRRR